MLYTIGHSTLTSSDFAALLKSVDCLELWDVRSHPTSKWTQFQFDTMIYWLPENGIKYVWKEDLGGWTEKHLHLRETFASRGVDLGVYARGKFPKQRIAGKQSGTGWTSVGLYDYSWYMSLTETLIAMEEMIQASQERNIAVCCCELLWWKCHRSMLADYAVWRGFDAVHLQPKRTLHSSALGNRLERYESEIIEYWSRFLESRT